MQDENTTRPRITYEYANSTNLPDRERAIYEMAADSIENSLAILAEIQDGRTNVNGDIERAPTLVELHASTELVGHLEQSITLLEAFDTGEAIL